MNYWQRVSSMYFTAHFCEIKKTVLNLAMTPSIPIMRVNMLQLSERGVTCAVHYTFVTWLHRQATADPLSVAIFIQTRAGDARQLLGYCPFHLRTRKSETSRTEEAITADRMAAPTPIVST
jgi:hypothetical protein